MKNVIVKNMVKIVDTAGMPAYLTTSIKVISGKCVQNADTFCNRNKIHIIGKY